MFQDYCPIFKPLYFFHLHCNVTVVLLPPVSFSRFTSVSVVHKIVTVSKL
jgi:hypothetical protein